MKRGALLLAATIACQAADLTGIWIGGIPTRRGDLQEVAFQFKQIGTKLEGKLYGDYQSSPIIRGTVNGDAVSFVVVAQEQAGNQINEVRLRFTGKIEAGSFELTRERESATNAGNSGGVQLRGSSTETFCLRRLL
jgi:hypothetical protein